MVGFSGIEQHPIGLAKLFQGLLQEVRLAIILARFDAEVHHRDMQCVTTRVLTDGAQRERFTTPLAVSTEQWKLRSEIGSTDLFSIHRFINIGAPQHLLNKAISCRIDKAPSVGACLIFNRSTGYRLL